MQRVIGWGIIGTGRVARDFASGLRHVEGARFAAVHSRSLDRAKQFAMHFGAPKAYDSAEAMLKDPEVDVVYVATPPHCHMDDALRAIAHGKAVLLEKPFTLDQASAKRVIAAARTAKVFCMEAMWMRFMPLVQEAKALVDQGAIGQVLMLTADFGYPAHPKAYPHLFDPEKGGGALLDRGVYLLSLSRLLFGAPLAVHAQASIGEGGVDEQCTIQLQHAGGAMASLSASLRALASNEAVIMGTRGTLRLHAPFYKPHRLSLTKIAAPTESAMPEIAGPSLIRRVLSSAFVRSVYFRLDPYFARGSNKIVRPYEGNGYSYEAREVTRCIREGRLESPLMPLDDTAAIMETIDAIRQSWQGVTRV